MAGRRTSSYARTTTVSVIGHNSQALSTVIFFVSGGCQVHVFSNDREMEHQAAVYADVTVHHVADDYRSRPEALPKGSFFLCVDREDQIQAIRGWLPPTLAVFLISHQRRSRHYADGLLSMSEPQSLVRHRLLKRLAIIQRVDALSAMARRSSLPLILIHGDPDPDAIGSALALATIFRLAGREPALRYTGKARRFQNRLLLGYLKEPFEELADTELAKSDLVALVDAQPHFWKDAPPLAQIIIDHHPLGPLSTSPFCDIREYLGATCTILTEYLFACDLPVSRRLATALLYGIITDTNDMQRNTSGADIKAFEQLHGRADLPFITRLNMSQVPLPRLDVIADGITRRVVHGDLMLIHFGEVDDPDLLVQVADLLLFTCGIYWVVCAGKHGDTLSVVLRGDGHRQNVGEKAVQAFGRIGSAGGHRTMGRAEIPLDGADLASTAALLVNNLFRRMKPERREHLIRQVRSRLSDGGPLVHPRKRR